MKENCIKLINDGLVLVDWIEVVLEYLSVVDHVFQISRVCSDWRVYSIKFIRRYLENGYSMMGKELIKQFETCFDSSVFGRNMRKFLMRCHVRYLAENLLLEHEENQENANIIWVKEEMNNLVNYLKVDKLATSQKKPSNLFTKIGKFFSKKTKQTVVEKVEESRNLNSLRVDSSIQGNLNIIERYHFVYAIQGLEFVPEFEDGELIVDMFLRACPYGSTHSSIQSLQAETPITVHPVVVNKNTTPRKKVAIIGSGISGSGSAYFLSDLVDEMNRREGEHSNKREIELVVFERNDQVGGRLKEVVLFNDEKEPYKYSCEVGGSSVILENRYILALIDKFKLTLKQPDFSDARIGVFNGDEKRMVFCESESWWKTAIQGAWRYDFGIPLFLLKRSVSNYLSKEKFFNIYRLQELPPNGPLNSETLSKLYTWETTEDFCKITGMNDLTKLTFYEYARKNWIQERFIREYCDPVLRINYMQNSDQISAYGGIIGLAGAVSEFRHIEEGTSRVPVGCLESIPKDRLTLKLNSEISEISFDPASNKYSLKTLNNSFSEFDYVIIATPLEFTNIKFENIKLPPSALQKRDMNILITSIVRAKDLNKNYFGVDCSQSDVFITTMKPNLTKYLAFNNIAPIGKTPDESEMLFETYSHEPLSTKTLQDIFVGATPLVQQIWKYGSYPILKPNNIQPPVKLHNNIYYTNSIESVVSTMETNLISAKNVSLLIGKSMVSQE